MFLSTMLLSLIAGKYDIYWWPTVLHVRANVPFGNQWLTLFY